KGETDFSVEEYKRPKFYAEFEKIKGTFKLNDKIKITGFAKAYAGNNIDGALVKYRVERNARFPYPWMFYRWYMPPTSSMEITHGEAKTDKDGKFTIEFEAIPDKTLDKKLDPIFEYTVYADVTDINGETRSSETVVSVGYKELLLKVDLPISVPVDSLKSIFIRTENMAGEFQPANVKVKITKLKEENRLIRPRYWDRPDQFVMSKSEYIKYFPNDEYDNETDYRSWEKGEKVFEKTDSAKEDGKWKIENGKIGTGFYMVEISTKDKNGEEVKDVVFIQLFDEKSKQLTIPVYLWTNGPEPIEPGEKTTIEIGTSANDLFVVKLITKPANNKSQTGNYEYVNINNEIKSFEFSATEADRGGYGVHFFFVKNNRVYDYNDVITIPWTNKDLTVEYATFRDKTLPGSEEKWKVKINGFKKEKIAAEMLASMYDASLDQFRWHRWNEPNIWRHYFSNAITWRGDFWISDHNFYQFESEQKPGNNADEEKTVEKWYEELITDIDNAVSYYDDKNKRYYKIITLQKMGLTGRAGGVTFMAATAPANQEGDAVLMRLPKPVFKNEEEAKKAQAAGMILPDEDGDGITDQFDLDNGPPKQGNEVQVRKNFNETAFFIPDLRTNENGDIEFSFTLPEALTKWKFQALAHTKELAFGYSSKEIITQKELMVQPNPPRFLREGDKM
ncbi:MAG TPA: alpha-2-macroglobulin family protein, partial [Chitinophagaceae bacterium]|nr:alpha-2-macroglobulin family protein [Chitinophagaceae bacterium]